MSKKFLFVLLILAVMASPLFASSVGTASTPNTTVTTVGEATTLNLTFVNKAVNLIVGIFAGGYVLVKAAMDIFAAVRHSDQDPNALKKAIGSLILNVAILASFLFIINYVFVSMAPTNGDAANFFTGLTGAFVSL